MVFQCALYGTCCALWTCVRLRSCHAGGGNIIGFSRGKTLKASALAKYGYTSPEAIAGLVRSGKVRRDSVVLSAVDVQVVSRIDAVVPTSDY